MIASSRRYQPAPNPVGGVVGLALAMAGEWRLVIGRLPEREGPGNPGIGGIGVVRSVVRPEADCAGGHTVCTVLRFGRIFAVKRFDQALKSSVFLVTLYRVAGNR
jgi:hypothetical protein